MMTLNRLVGAIAITALFGAFNTEPAAAQTIAPGPYYATPSWDQTLPANSRFIILSNMNSEAFLDRETGLVWARANAVQFIPKNNFTLIENNQSGSQRTCSNLTAGNRKGWRLPFIDELMTLVDPSGPSAAPLLITLGPSGEQNFWTMNDPFDNDGHDVVNLPSGFVFYSSNGHFGHLALCVRGRQ